VFWKNICLTEQLSSMSSIYRSYISESTMTATNSHK